MAPDRKTANVTRKALSITREQAKVVLTAKAALDNAQERLNLALAAIVGGHGYSEVPVVQIDAEKLTLTIEVAGNGKKE